MKLNILSDLHLSVARFAPPDNRADAIVLAGDIARPWDAVTWAERFDKPVLYVPGNHEFYGDTLDGTIRRLREACAGTQVQVLDDDEVVLDGVRFLGSTLWTDFRLFGDGDRRAAAMSEGRRWIREFTRIRTAGSPVHPGTLGHVVRRARPMAGGKTRRAASGTHGRHHASRAVAVEHSPALRPLAAQCLLRRGCRAPARRNARACGSTGIRTTASTMS